MKNYCDYDAITLYPSGAFNAKYKTQLTGKLKKVEQIRYNAEITSSFQNGEYQSFITVEPLTLYRVFGKYSGSNSYESEKGARLKGAFASTEFAESVIDAKMRLALDPAWFNTKMYEVKLMVPIGVEISVGIVAEVRLKTGTILPGGADQVLLPFDWPDSWIVGYRRIRGRQLQSVPYYSPEPIGMCDGKDSVYRKVCPACGCEEVRRLPIGEQFVIIGCRGNAYTMQNACLNPECQYYW